MGAAVAVADFDRDGWQDFYVTNSARGQPQPPLPQQGRRHVRRRRASRSAWPTSTAASTGVSMGAVWGDYDNDGWEDLFLYKYGRPELFHNDEGRAFVAGRRARRPAGWVNANSATWLDYDRDGRLDLFLAGYWPDDVDLWKLETTRIMPESFEYANNGGRKYLLRNRGDGTFEDVTAALGIRSRRWTLAVTAADLLGTGYPDLFLANDYGVSELFANRERQALRRRRRRDRRRARAEERHERVGRRRLQRRPAGDLQDEHLRAGRARAGQRPLGAEGGRRRGARVREPGVERWASISAAGAGARSSAT